MTSSSDSAEGKSVVRVQSTTKSTRRPLLLSRVRQTIALPLALAMALAGFGAEAAAEPENAAPPAVSSAAAEAESEASSPEAGAETVPDPAEAEGLAELERASEFLKAGEKASEDDEKIANYEIAAKHAERAVELLPDNADAHFVLFGAKGRVAQMGGLASAALALSSLNSELDEVLRLDPDHSDALAARGGMLMKLPRLMGGNTTEGIKHLERAVEINPNGAGTRLELAEAYEIVGRDVDAMKAGREALAIAKRKNEPKKVERAETFLADLEKSCDGCALAAAPQ